MKENKNNVTIFFIAFIFLITVLFSCSSYETIIEDFDKNFVNDSESKKSALELETKNLIPLNSYYFNKLPSIFILSTQEEFQSYKWEIIRSDLEDAIQIGNSQTLTYIMPGDFSNSADNFLLITVIDKDGKEYTDKATIIIK